MPVSRNAPPDYGGVGESLSAPPYDVEVMAVLLFKCPETETPVDLGEVSPEAHLALSLWSRPITCPHCGNDHRWTSAHLRLAMQALQGSPQSSRVLIDDALDRVEVTALP